MLRHATTILLLIWLVPFFGVIAPGHQRGAIQLPGSDLPGVAATTCVLCVSWSNEDGQTPGSPTDPAGNCAVCQFIGTLLNPPPIFLADLSPRRVDLPRNEPAVGLRPAPAPLPRLAGRAPPTGSAFFPPCA